MRDRILQESIISLRREGLRFSVDTLAERLKISKKTVYKHFPDKESLALALYERYYDDALAQVEAARDPKALLELYFDAKWMIRGEVFNKYKLNASLYAFTAARNDGLWARVLARLGRYSQRDGVAIRILVDVAFEKLCACRASMEEAQAVIDRLVRAL